MTLRNKDQTKTMNTPYGNTISKTADGSKSLATFQEVPTRMHNQHQTIQPSHSAQQHNYSNSYFDPKANVHRTTNSLAHQHSAKRQDPFSAMDNPKNYADLRLKLGDKKDTDSSVPSDLSEDEWVEIVKYRKKQYEEDKKKEAQQFVTKRQQLRDVLDR